MKTFNALQDQISLAGIPDSKNAAEWARRKAANLGGKVVYSDGEMIELKFKDDATALQFADLCDATGYFSQSDVEGDDVLCTYKK